MCVDLFVSMCNMGCGICVPPIKKRIKYNVNQKWFIEVSSTYECDFIWE